MNQDIMKWFPKNRLEALTDGVYAVALTLLVLDLKLPAGSMSHVVFLDAINDQISNFITWILSFWVIIIFWQVRIRLIQCINHVGNTYIQLEFVHLALICLLPFPTSLVGEYYTEPLAFLIYTGNLWLLCLLGFFQVLHIKKSKQLVASEVSQIEVESQLRGVKIVLVSVTVALALAYFLPGWNLLAILIPKFFFKD